jgi:hypothetical protein
MNITCLPNATKPHKRKSLMILFVSTANFEPWPRSGGLAPLFLNFRLLCKSVVTRHAPDNLGQCKESPVPTVYEVSCAPNTVCHFAPFCFFLSSSYPCFPSFPSLSCSNFFYLYLFSLVLFPYISFNLLY